MTILLKTNINDKVNHSSAAAAESSKITTACVDLRLSLLEPIVSEPVRAGLLFGKTN